jgi:xanthine dehydrogenase accessory factor
MQLTEPVLVEAVAAMARGEAVAFATVVSVSGSTPRHLGARMAATATTQWGTIGGGRVEQAIVAGLRRALLDGVGGFVEHHLVRDLAMCCGGSMGFALTLAAPSAAALQAAVGQLRNGGGGQLQTALDGSGFSFVAERDAHLRQPQLRDGMLCEPIGVPPRAIVFGLGHVARAIGPLAHAVGFDVVVCDDGETQVHDEPLVAPAWASRLIESFEPRDVARTLGGFWRNDYILIVTRDHAVDQRIVEALIDEPSVALIGMIGSRGKVARFRKRLLAKGLIAADDDPRWLRIVAPIGLDIGAETPPEIAVAVVAQLIAHYRTGRAAAGQWLPR